MAGFKLIATYSSSESDNDEDKVEKVMKSQCNTLTSNNKQSSENNKKLLPLPNCIALWTINDKYNDDEEVATIIDDNEIDKHKGRIRSFKHERGNWATLIYIKHSLNEYLLKWISSTIEILPINGNLIIDDTHISLTRTLILKFHWIESFVVSLKNICRTIDKFTMDMTNVKLYCNDERTRTFIGIECQSYHQNFHHLLELLNKLLTEYELPPYYDDASYHISFYWTLGDKEMELKSFIPLLNDNLHTTLNKDIKNNSILVSELNCKIGNKSYIFPLR